MLVSISPPDADNLSENPLFMNIVVFVSVCYEPHVETIIEPVIFEHSLNICQITVPAPAYRWVVVLIVPTLCTEMVLCYLRPASYMLILP